MKKPIDERYIQRLVATPDGGLMILTCLSALMKLLDDTGVTSFETDTTFRRVAGKINEWEVVIFLKALERGERCLSHSSEVILISDEFSCYYLSGLC